MRIRLTTLLAAALALAPSTRTCAAWIDFAPRPFENGAYLELFGSEERDHNDDNGRSYGWSDTFFTQKVTLFSDGYVYHPRFLRYHLSFSGGLKEERYDPSFGPSTGWTRSPAFEYEGRLLFLPEHPYNFEMWALRREPLYKEQSATQHQAVETSNGASFRYRSRPWFAHAGFIDNTTHTHTSTSEVRRWNFDGEYFKDFAGGNVFSTTAFFIPTQFTGDQGLAGDSTEYGATGLLDVRTVRWSFTASKSDYNQSSVLAGQLANDQFSFLERLSAFLPLHFTMDFDYRILNSDSTTRQPLAPVARELTDDSKDFQAILSHRLYQSLDSRYIFLRSVRDSSGGNSTAISHTLGFDYAKSIPRGRVFANLNLATIDTDSAGRSDIASEPHLAVPVPGAFPLSQPNADPASLSVFVRSPLPPFQTIPLVENVHYTVTLIGNTLTVNVFLLPPPLGPGTYDFVVSYSLLVGVFELRTNTLGLDTSVALLDNMLTPYYRFAVVRSDVLSGTFVGLPLDSTSNTLGLTFLDGNWRATGEYQSLDWEISPYRQYRVEGQYNGSIDPTLRLYGTTTLVHRYYPHGTSPDSPAAYTENSANLSGGVQKDFLERTLSLSAGASYNRTNGIVDSSAYALSTSLLWRVGKLELWAGTDAFGSEANAGFSGGQYNRLHQYYYFKIRRRIF